MDWLMEGAVVVICNWFDLKLDIYVQSNHICTGASDWRKIVIRNHVQSGLAAVAEWLRRLAKSRIHVGSIPTDCKKLFHIWTGRSTHYFCLELEINLFGSTLTSTLNSKSNHISTGASVILKWPFTCVLSYLSVIWHPVCLAQWLEHLIGSVMVVGSKLICDNNFFSYVVSMLSLCRLYVISMSSLCHLYVISFSEA